MAASESLRYGPAMLLTFGIGWLIGADAAWYWGALAVIVAGYWQHLRVRSAEGVTIAQPKEEEPK